MPIAFESFKFDGYELVISLTSEAAKGIITKPGTLHICYCLTPTRYLWSGYDEYFSNKSLKFLSKPIVNALRFWDKKAAQRPDAFIAISKEVQKRIKKYYGRESELVYPPVSLKNVIARIKGTKQSLQKDRHASLAMTRNGYFLVVSRLSKFTTYKRIDLAIKACNELNFPLKIIGEGSWKKELVKISGPTIDFVKDVNDKELVSYYQNCKALIFPGFEDFGLVMVEAQMAGKPVIAFRKGGAEEIIIEGKTGLFFDDQNVNSLSKVLEKFEKYKFDPKECLKNAEKFSMDMFKKDFLSVVNKLI